MSFKLRKMKMHCYHHYSLISIRPTRDGFVKKWQIKTTDQLLAPLYYVSVYNENYFP